MLDQSLELSVSPSKRDQTRSLRPLLRYFSVELGGASCVGATLGLPLAIQKTENFMISKKVLTHGTHEPNS